MKGKNWREYEPEERRRQPKRRRRRRRKTGLWLKLIFALILFGVGYFGFDYLYLHSKPYLVAVDPGHGGVDVGAEGIINEVDLTEMTAEKLTALLEADGRFRVVSSREAGETMSITDRNHLFQRKKPDLVLSIHGNSGEESQAYGFECYPSPPGLENHGESLAFAQVLAAEMGAVGARLRGENGVRFGYYAGVAEESGSTKILVDASDTTIYTYDTFGILKNMTCPAVLVEQCFVTNESDVAQFATEEGCQKAAEAYYRGICNYLEGLDAGSST